MVKGTGCVKFGDALYQAAVKLADSPNGVIVEITPSTMTSVYQFGFAFDGRKNTLAIIGNEKSGSVGAILFFGDPNQRTASIDEKGLVSLQKGTDTDLGQRALSHAFYTLLGMDPKQQYCDGAPEIESGWFFWPNTPIKPDEKETSSAIENALRGMGEVEANVPID